MCYTLNGDDWEEKEVEIGKGGGGGRSGDTNDNDGINDYDNINERGKERGGGAKCNILIFVLLRFIINKNYIINIELYSFFKS